jgi:2-polyprenyl-3-methyl-5-hydroxy-6-metoxy-1,4-benzoquinol methylase
MEDDYPISKCPTCGFVYVNAIPIIKDGRVLDEYYEGVQQEIEAGKLRYEPVSEFIVKEINLHSKKGKMLDVGCGYGFFLLEAQRNGWDVYGTELSKIAVEYANKKQNLKNVFYCDLPDNKFEELKFEAINLTNVLEHVPSPTKTLLDCKKLLFDQGVMTIRVPNVDFNDLKRKLIPILKFLKLGKGGDLSYLASPPPIHLSGFSQKTLRKYFEKVDLQVIEIKPSKLSSLAQENILYSFFESLVSVIHKISFHTINLSPTIFAIVRKK